MSSTPIQHEARVKRRWRKAAAFLILVLTFEAALGRLSFEDLGCIRFCRSAERLCQRTCKQIFVDRGFLALEGLVHTRPSLLIVGGNFDLGPFDAVGFEDKSLGF